MTIKSLNRPEPSLCEMDQDDKRLLLLEEREVDRGHQRERESQCLPLEDWTPEQHLELELSVAADPIRGRARPARAVQHGPVTGRQVNPFRQADTLNRPLQKLRVTTALSRQQVAHLHEMVLRANCMGLVMDALVTISWKLAGIGEADVGAAQSRVMRRVREWSAKRSRFGKRLDAQVGWIWIQEQGDTVGVHTHFLFCCPTQERTGLLRVIERAVATAARTNRAGTLASGVLSRLPLDGRTVDLSDRPEYDGVANAMRRQWTLFGYVTKTATVSHQLKPGAGNATGRIVGKRAGFSHHLLGAAPWKRFANDHGRPQTWIKDFLKTTAQPFPLKYGLYTAPLWFAEPQAKVSAPRQAADAYPKTPDAISRALRALKVSSGG